jgi:CRP/FNR family transcriptional regulator, cyclic AMP receptor protein
MDLQEQLELLCRVDIFESLPKEEVRGLLRDLIQQNAEIHLGAGEVFYTPQEPDGSLFILTKGRVRIYRMEAPRELTLEMVDAGTVFGEVSFTAHRLRDAYAEAMEPSTLLAMQRADVERLIQQKPQVGIKIISLLSERLHYHETRMQDVTLRLYPKTARLSKMWAQASSTSASQFSAFFAQRVRRLRR